MKILVTGGAGFIGSTVIRYLINELGYEIINVDKLTYAANSDSLSEVSNSSLYSFEKVDVCDAEKIARILNKYEPDKIMHLAAESHVDRSIDLSGDFIKTNIFGTFVMVEEARKYWQNLEIEKQKTFRFHHISTDEVFGDLPDTDILFTEDTPYSPSSPYSASKAGADHIVRAWHRTYNLPVVITNCSNNYGPYQFPEKLIPLIILNAISGKPLPVYGKGEQIRDWLYVGDHARALVQVMLKGENGETYNIGAANERRNIDVVRMICNLLDELVPQHPNNINKYEELITYVEDRPGHDKRYAIDASKIKNKIQWKPIETFETGLRKTVDWYINNEKWWSKLLNDGNYCKRFGLQQKS